MPSRAPQECDPLAVSPRTVNEMGCAPRLPTPTRQAAMQTINRVMILEYIRLTPQFCCERLYSRCDHVQFLKAGARLQQLPLGIPNGALISDPGSTEIASWIRNHLLSLFLARWRIVLSGQSSPHRPPASESTGLNNEDIESNGLRIPACEAAPGAKRSVAGIAPRIEAHDNAILRVLTHWSFQS